jgi:hypothetical protein
MGSENFEYIPIPKLSDFPLEEQTAAVKLLLNICDNQQKQLRKQEEIIIKQSERLCLQEEQLQLQSEQIALQSDQIQKLKDEIAVLKGEKGRPNIKPSTLNKGKKGNSDKGGKQRKRGKPSKKKTAKLEIHKVQIIQPEHIPEGAKFKGYEDYVVQDIEINLKNTKFRRARYQTEDGEEIVGKLPDSVSGSHFGSALRSFVISQHHEQRVPQNLILKQLWEFGVQISAGQLNRIITEGHEGFHAEKEEILRVGLKVSSYINVDDTGARHKGKNGYCTHIGNEFFAWFSSTESKSRINFLELLSAADSTDYVVDKTARQYMKQQKLPNAQLALFSQDKVIGDKVSWEYYLESIGISNERHKRIATEGALVGALVLGGIDSELVIVSDDAGQFKIAGFLNALCWVHAERTINKIIPFSDTNREMQECVRDQIWDFYQQLKDFKASPAEKQKRLLEKRFDKIFTQKTCFQTLNNALGRIHDNKDELLLVLQRPEIPLHNNLSENDIRDYVTKRKISATTRSDDGRKARDTFLSLKKTCQKLGISFRKYLQDRISRQNQIPSLPILITTASQAP